MQQEQDFDGAVMERLRSYSLAELEHLFLEFYVELTAVRAHCLPLGWLSLCQQCLCLCWCAVSWQWPLEEYLGAAHSCECTHRLLQGHTIGRLLLHGLQGEDRERERSNLNAVASRAERNLHTKHNNLCFHPESRDIQFDSEALPLCGAHGFTRSVGASACRNPFLGMA